MTLLRATEFVSVVCLSIALMLGPGFSQSIPAAPTAATSTVTVQRQVEVQQPARAYPHIRLWGGQELTYVGMFSPDATYRKKSRVAEVSGYTPGEGIPAAPSSELPLQHGKIPASWMLPNERVVENLEPPAHAAAVAQASSRAAETRNRFVTYAYGRPSVLHAPTHVVTDSQQRLIVSDPAGNAVLVLDPNGKTSFRILSGEGRRLQQPAGVAVDADDSIYVADSARGMVLVFDHYGNFLRYIGDYQGEPQYASPHGIAIDRKAGRLYLVDSPRNLVFMLDLTGKVLKRVGKFRDGTGVGEFDEPTDIAINRNRVFVLDAAGGRVQAVDSDCNLLGSFNLPRSRIRQLNRENGLGADQQGNVYISSFHGSVIRVFSPDGLPLASIGQLGHRAGEFANPNGLWIDPANRLYVADSGNGRIQLFELNTP